MPHASNIICGAGPNSPDAFGTIPEQPRNGSLDSMCSVCQGRGQWNTEIGLVCFRCKRAPCDRCHGAGWVETGNDPVGLPDIVLSPHGHPQWTIRYEAPEKAPDVDRAHLGLAQEQTSEAGDTVVGSLDLGTPELGQT